VNWLNIEISKLRAPEYIGHEPPQRAAWIQVLAWCCEQENGGRIPGAAEWGDRRWMQTCGVTRKEVQAAKGLLNFEGDDLTVWGYSTEKQDEVQQRRMAARGAASARWGAGRDAGGTSLTDGTGNTAAGSGRSAIGNASRNASRNAHADAAGNAGADASRNAHADAAGNAGADASRNAEPTKSHMRNENENENENCLPPCIPPPGGGGRRAEPAKKARKPSKAETHDQEVNAFLKTAAFANAAISNLFCDWMGERRKAGKYATARACQEALKKLSAYPPAVQEAALRDSIANSWQGVFPEKQRTPPPNRRPIQHLDTTIDDRTALAEHLRRPQRF